MDETPTGPEPIGEPPPPAEANVEAAGSEGIEGSEEDPPRRQRRLRGGRLAATSVAVLVLVSGGAAVALGGGSGDDDGSDGVASLSPDDGGNGGESADDSGDGGGGGSGRVDSSEFEDAALAYAECMRDHGVDMPDPQFNGDGGVMQEGPPIDSESDREAFESADEECRSIMEEAIPEGRQLSPEEQAERQDQLLAMAQCMRDRGYDFPDPQVDDQGRVTIGGGPDRGPRPGGDGQPDDQFVQDMEECSEEAGIEGPGGGGGLSTNSSDEESSDGAST